MKKSFNIIYSFGSAIRSFAVFVLLLLTLALEGCLIYGLDEEEKNYDLYSLRMASYEPLAVYRAFAFDEKTGFSYAANEDLRCVDVIDKDGVLYDRIYGPGAESEKYKNISDLAITDQYLFVATHQGNRVDVYTLPARDKTFVMSLGNGNGNNNGVALMHPQAVAANDEFVFVLTYGNGVSVYTTDTLTKENHKKAKKFSFLDAKNAASNLMREAPYLTLRDNKLFVTNDSNDFFYEFYLSDIKKSDSANPIQPRKAITDVDDLGGRRFHGLAFGDGFVAVAQGNNQNNRRVALYKTKDFEKYKFDNPISVINGVFGEKFMTDPKHIYLRGNTLYITTIGYSNNNANFTINSGKTFVVDLVKYTVSEL